VLDPANLVDDPHLRERGGFAREAHEVGAMIIPLVPLRVGATPFVPDGWTRLTP
jgi:hypothetical protein